jgi:serine/threonine protein kinase
MDWATRIATAKGIARGLAYLHDDMSIIHGNLTARNVLFDEQSQPKIADFGLFRFMTAATNYNVLDKVRELGYCAPELINLMNASAKTDVYSLGIIILQLLTGTLRGGMAMLQWVGFNKSVGLTTKVFDMELMQDEDAGRSRKDELEATLMLALQCVDPSPLVRPQAWEVLAKLEKICPGQENATGPSKDPSPSMQLQARNDLEQVRLQQPADLFKVSLII